MVLKASLRNFNKSHTGAEAGVGSNSKERIATITKQFEANHIGADGCLLVEKFQRARNILCAESLVGRERSTYRTSKNFFGYDLDYDKIDVFDPLTQQGVA